MRSADWTTERNALTKLGEQITSSMAGNAAVASLAQTITDSWSGLHKGKYLTDPKIAFGRGEIEGVLDQLTVTFTPSPGGDSLGFDRLSDGQKSLLYVSLVVASLGVGREVLAGTNPAFDPHKLRPPVHTVIAIEEPENSLSPHYLGRITRLVKDASKKGDVQGVLATHAPSMLKRVDPMSIRYLRLDDARVSRVREIPLPPVGTDETKFVREAVQSFPELYFSRLVVLGEGDSEQIVIPRILAAAGIAEDDASVSVVPLGGRFVHHLWRLLDGLGIPYVTLLDLDSGRFQGGWGRVSYVLKQMNLLKPGTVSQDKVDAIPPWNADKQFPTFTEGSGAIAVLEGRGVYYSHPVDLDLMLMEAYPNAYGATLEEPEESDIVSVLGKSHTNEDKLDESVLKLFESYHRMFKLGSKPATHIAALASLTDTELLADLPAVLGRLVEAVQTRLGSIPE